MSHLFWMKLYIRNLLIDLCKRLNRGLFGCNGLGTSIYVMYLALQLQDLLLSLYWLWPIFLHGPWFMCDKPRNPYTRLLFSLTFAMEMVPTLSFSQHRGLTQLSWSRGGSPRPSPNLEGQKVTQWSRANSQACIGAYCVSIWITVLSLELCHLVGYDG